MTCEVPGCTRRAVVVLVGRDGIARSVCAFHSNHSHTRERTTR